MKGKYIVLVKEDGDWTQLSIAFDKLKEAEDFASKWISCAMIVKVISMHTPKEKI